MGNSVAQGKHGVVLNGGGVAAVGSGRVQVAASEIFRVAGMAAYHTSLILDDKEFYFDSSGIVQAPALWSHLLSSSEAPPPLQILDFGCSALTGKALHKGLAALFAEGTYDVLCKNCNAFTDAALYFLTRSRLDPQFSRVERWLVATTPMSINVLNGLLRAAFQSNSNEPDGDKGYPGAYVMNPHAVGFSVENVVAACDARDAEAGKGVGIEDPRILTCSLSRGCCQSSSASSWPCAMERFGAEEACSVMPVGAETATPARSKFVQIQGAWSPDAGLDRVELHSALARTPEQTPEVPSPKGSPYDLDVLPFPTPNGRVSGAFEDTDPEQWTLDDEQLTNTISPTASAVRASIHDVNENVW